MGVFQSNWALYTKPPGDQYLHKKYLTVLENLPQFWGNFPKETIKNCITTSLFHGILCDIVY